MGSHIFHCSLSSPARLQFLTAPLLNNLGAGASSARCAYLATLLGTHGFAADAADELAAAPAPEAAPVPSPNLSPAPEADCKTPALRIQTLAQSYSHELMNCSFH